ncbi:MAG: peptidylprolyl isomerase [Saprospiraceae bacterium]|nr:peptidylprolyl isomerase [Saprospiraceae bacterium]
MKTVTYILFFLSVPMIGYSQSEIIDKIAAYVGSELVLLSEVEEQFQLMKDRGVVSDESQKCDILENLMVQKLLVNQARLDSIEVLEEEIELQLDARIDRILSMMNNDVAQFEEYYGKSITEVKQQFRQDLESQLLAERMQAKAMAQVKVTPSEVIDFFHQVPPDSLPYFNAEVEIAEIVAYPKVNETEKQLAQQKLEKLKARIEAGESFEALAGQFSDDPGSAQKGGNLGWMKRGSLVPEYEAAAYNLEEDQISDIVESEFGLHLIQLLDRRGNSILTRHILIKPQITDADELKAINYLDSVRNVIIEDSIDFTRAVQAFSNEKTPSYSNGGRLTNPATGNTFFEVGDLDPDIYFTIDTMKVGEISQPIEFKNRQGEKGYRIIKLLSFSDPHRANLKQDYFKIQKAAVEQKKNEKFFNWIRSRAENTFVKVEAPFNVCPNIQAWTGVEAVGNEP